MHDVAVIGAGPYGLSIAAHLAKTGLDTRIFGTPMQTWRTQMPAGMKLKSEGFASRLYDPDGAYPLARYCAEQGLPYADMGLPVRLDIFTGYGLAFQKKCVPGLEDSQVVSVVPNAAGGGFSVTLDTGETAQFRKVVVAVGISHYAYTAPELAGLPAGLVSHSAAHADLSGFAGKTVAVIGGGASAADCAALLAQAGATTHIVTRRASLGFHAPPRKRGLLDKLRAPFTTIGPGWKSVLCTKAPLLFHIMPEAFRLKVTRRYLGPAPCWFVRDEIERNVKIHAGMNIAGVSAQGDQVVLALDGAAGPEALVADHVIAATGYRVDLARLAFLGPALLQRIRMVENTPILSRHFEASVPGLYFVGVASANSFGPMVRFACGAGFTARRLVRRLVQVSGAARPSRETARAGGFGLGQAASEI
jgi:thioredoxin reductase